MPRGWLEGGLLKVQNRCPTRSILGCPGGNFVRGPRGCAVWRLLEKCCTTCSRRSTTLFPRSGNTSVSRQWASATTRHSRQLFLKWLTVGKQALTERLFDPRFTFWGGAIGARIDSRRECKRPPRLDEHLLGDVGLKRSRRCKRDRPRPALKLNIQPAIKS